MDSPAICKYKDWYLGDRRQCDYAGLVAEGKGLWWYQSCMSEGCASAVQPAHGSSSPGCDKKSSCTNGVYTNTSTGHTTAWPSYMIDAPATLNRAMSWLSYKYSIQGELCMCTSSLCAFFRSLNEAAGHQTGERTRRTATTCTRRTPAGRPSGLLGETATAR